MNTALFLLFLLIHQTSARPNIPLQKDVEPPQMLSQTAIFEGDVTNLKSAADGLSYDIIQPLFVDFAKKQRILFLPENTKVTFALQGAFGFPVGTILVKHFKMEMSKDVFRNIETRVLVRKEGDTPQAQNWVGYTYKWEGNDATLVDASSNPEVPLDVDATAEGGARQQKFKIPSRAQCLQCHNSSVGYVRSLEVKQLNRDFDGHNQLDKMNQSGLFDHDIGAASALEKYAAVDDEAETLEKRVKTYVAVNCSHCHNPDPKAMCSFTGLDFRYDTFSVDALVASGHVVKGSKADSQIFERMSSTRPGFRMPFIGALIPDQKALSTIGRYIDGLTPMP